MSKKNEDTYGTNEARQVDIKTLFRIYSDIGISRLYVKALSPNDNSKNQIYLGGDFSAINVIPVKSWETFLPSSQKPKLKPGKRLIRGQVDFHWLDRQGNLFNAPDAKLILYPQYPEVRFSGFLKGSQINLTEWMDVAKSGRSEGRFLLIGIHNSGKCFGYIAAPGSRLAYELEKIGFGDSETLLKELIITDKPGTTSKELLIRELRRIYQKSPIASKKLDSKTGIALPYKAPNGAGLTLEAELGVFPNGYAAPDFEGWELKAHGGNIITLMTPEPSGGIYKEKGVDSFIRAYGYTDKNGKVDRLNIGGVHKVGERHNLTNLLMQLSGYDAKSKEIDISGSILLNDQAGKVAAEWSFEKLLEHWNKKHAQAAYVPYKKQLIEGNNWYSYSHLVGLGEGTDFLKFIDAFDKQYIYYDPGIKLVGIDKTKPEIKRRSQFRINYKNLPKLYGAWEETDVLKSPI